LPEKSKFHLNLPGKIEILLTRIHDPQISNQIDAAQYWLSSHFDQLETAILVAQEHDEIYRICTQW